MKTTNSSCKRKGCKVITLPTLGVKDPCKKELWYVDMKKKIKKPKYRLAA